jgi:hypothetical protein
VEANPVDLATSGRRSDHVDHHWSFVEEPQQRPRAPVRDDRAGAASESRRAETPSSAQASSPDGIDAMEDPMEARALSRPGDLAVTEAKCADLAAAHHPKLGRS